MTLASAACHGTGLAQGWAHPWETGTFPRSAPCNISADQLTDRTWVGTLHFFALCSSETAPGRKGILRPASTTKTWQDRHSSQLRAIWCYRTHKDNISQEMQASVDTRYIVSWTAKGSSG